MIGKLTGLLDSVHDGFLILDAGGVGYRVFCSAKTFSKLPPLGGGVSLLIETQVREDHIHLFGFGSAAEKQAFGYLTEVQGVGAKVALAILSALTPEEIQMAVMTGDAKAFTRAGGVGPKLGARLVTELKSKLGALGAAEPMPALAGGMAGGRLMDEAVSALVNLGYARMDAGVVVAQLLRDNAEMALNDLIRAALKDIGKGKAW
ncbi:MAG: Holliday junction branch migration protein RuvA [Alphaproteobacteria bacterium]|nr:Holliday junction branch migration protein RuvA [Alphaproteobacteria bacterium]